MKKTILLHMCVRAETQHSVHGELAKRKRIVHETGANMHCIAEEETAVHYSVSHAIISAREGHEMQVWFLALRSKNTFRIGTTFSAKHSLRHDKFQCVLHAPKWKQRRKKC